MFDFLARHMDHKKQSESESASEHYHSVLKPQVEAEAKIL